MPISILQKADFTVIEFDGELTIFTVHEVFSTLLPITESLPRKIIADLSAVVDFDSSGLQLLLWFAEQCLGESELTVTLGDNDVIHALLQLYQLSEADLNVTTQQDDA
ncbi:STAS domain-containing protein [Vibrio navarrensis]|uniref:STAS domain-containing protein n=1 Tax=Vibrio navarrensis TaxID=29495 RepID=UPI00186AB699|nr:STAS domain-containing protein [Vibrio navarrensis]MBE4620708.1 hypothetical protein [Vibrio navarrensis]